MPPAAAVRVDALDNRNFFVTTQVRLAPKFCRALCLRKCERGHEECSDLSRARLAGLLGEYSSIPSLVAASTLAFHSHC